MDKEDKIIEEFFRSLRVTLTNAFSYSKDHPYFIKSVKNFKVKLEETLGFFNPLKIGVTDATLVVDGKNLIGSGFYDELARILHQRKIKSIEIRHGATLQELVQFFSVISMSQKDVFKNGGIRALLKKEELLNFTIEELDYSAFLQGEAQECKNIWGYMLREAAYSNDLKQLDKLADDFGALIKRFDEKDMFNAEGVSEDVNEFLLALKEKDREKFDKCSKDVFLWILQNKKSLDPQKLEKLKTIFDGLGLNELSGLFWEGLSQEENFDALSLRLFSKISDKKSLPEVSERIYNKISETQDLEANPKIVKKIRNLLSANEDDSLSVVYRSTLESLIKGISSSGKLSLDQQSLRNNYRYILLSLFLTENDRDILQEIAIILEQGLGLALGDNDLDFFRDLWAAVLKRKKENLAVCAVLEKGISVFIENIVLNGSLTEEQGFLVEMVTAPSQALVLYLEKIFTSERANPYILRLFFRLFPGHLDVFYENLSRRYQDMDFLSSVAEALGQMDASIATGVLENLYSSTNELIKVEVLKAMRRLKKVDSTFLLRQLNTNSVLLRREIVSVLMLDKRSEENMLNILFRNPGFWGAKHKLLMENMQIVFDLDFRDAAGKIKELSRGGLFWGQALKNKARQILKEWNVN